MVIVAGIFWGTMGVFSNELNSLGFNSMENSAIRLITCALVFVILNFRKLKIDPRDIWKFCITGIFSILAMSLTYFESIKRSSLTIASILLYTAPIMVTVMSAIFYKEKITPVKLLCLVGAILGIVLISGTGGKTGLSTAGLIFGLLSGFSYALYSILGKMILKKYEPFTLFTYAFIFAAIGSCFVCDIPSIASKTIASKNIVYTVMIMAGCGIVTSAVPYTLYTLGLKYMPAGKASILACVEPLTATIIGISFYGDRLGVVSANGIVLIISSVVVISLFKTHSAPSNGKQ